MPGKINQEERARVAWDYLISAAVQGSKVTYGQLGKAVGTHYRAARFYLELIQNYCLEQKLPPLTILAVYKSGKPGSGFIAWDVDNLEDGYRSVWEYNWRSTTNPFNYAKDDITQAKLATELIQWPEKSSEIYSRVKVRGVAQEIFRKALLKVYRNKCSFCEVDDINILEASHIKPWRISDNSERLDVRNGILLCSNHHRLFDSQNLFINDDYVISCAEHLAKKHGLRMWLVKSCDYPTVKHFGHRQVI